MGWSVQELDILLSKRHDLTHSGIAQHWLSRISSNEFAAVIASPPCDQFTRVKFANSWGPPPLRTAEWLRGFDWLSPKQKRLVGLSNTLADFTLKAVGTQLQMKPGLIALEFPEDLGAVRGGKWHGIKPASLWQFPAYHKLLAEFSLCSGGLLQAHIGAPYLKPTRLVLRHEPHFGANFFVGSPVMDENGFYMGPVPRVKASEEGLQTLAKTSAEAGFRTTGTAAWPPQLCQWVATELNESWKNFDMASEGVMLAVEEISLAGKEDINGKADQAGYATEMPMAGYWVGGVGQPRQTYTLGKTRAYHDGWGLPSPGRWEKQDRVFPSGGKWNTLRTNLFECLSCAKKLDGRPLGSSGIQRLMFVLACSPKTDVFEERWIEAGRKVIKDWLRLHSTSFKEDAVDVAEGQPFLLHMLGCLLKEMKDADADLPAKLETGVFAGILTPLPRNRHR